MTNEASVIPEMRVTLTLNDFDFLWSTAMNAFFFFLEQAERFEIVKPNGLDPDAKIPEKSGWMMYWFGDMTSKSDALLAWKIIVASGHEGYLLWDCADPEPTLIDPLYNQGWVILTDYRGSYL